MDKPYLLRPWEIEKLTDRQIVELYYRRRDDKGVPVNIPDEKHEWNTRKKIVPIEDMVLQKYLSFMKMGASLGVGESKMKNSWIRKFGSLPPGIK
mgnify:FL=1|jgi:hypothetical protein|tara:strand:- start:192 stop:476 length:285 start_codon:yes stop_codon:yes gene_type:complete